jgi:ribosomal 30S subunit maturation factor RimM
LIFLGKIVKTRGNKGEVVIAPSPQVERYIPGQGEGVVLQSTKYQIQRKIEYLKNIRGKWVFKFVDTNTINDAYKLVGYSIYSTKISTSPGNDMSTVTEQAAKGVEFTVKDVSGCVWGNVKHIETYGVYETNQILEVVGNEGDVIYVPFSEGIVKKIDREKKIIFIDPPDGLKGLNKE